MTTPINKPVSREFSEWQRRGVFGLGVSGSKPVVVTMEKGGIISLRIKGTRKTYSVDIETVYNMALRRESMESQNDQKPVRRKRMVSRSLLRQGA